MAKITVTREIEVPDDAPDMLAALQVAVETLHGARRGRDEIIVALRDRKVPLRVVAECADLSMGQLTRMLSRANKEDGAADGAKPKH